MKRRQFSQICFISLSRYLFTLSLNYQTSIRGRLVHYNPLFTTDASSPFTYSIASIKDLDSSKNNFLATQVWPSARVASNALLELCEKHWKVCELGCGPGLPSMIAAKIGCPMVVATDLDELALDLVQAAANDQGFDQLVTKRLDLTQPLDVITSQNSWLNEIDLFVMSDIFEDTKVACGAAAFTKKILGCHTKSNNNKQPRIWVFAQSDRAQRDIYLKSMQEIYPQAQWSPLEDYYSKKEYCNKLWLVDLDETKVKYG